MASNMPAVATETDAPAKLWLPTPASPSQDAPCGPVKVGLPTKAVCWKDADLSQDDLPLRLPLPANSPSADGSGTPGVARSRSGSSMLSPPGLEAPAGLASLGSVLHGTGNCRPCAWFWKQSGCQNAKECNHCHLCAEGEIKGRKKNKLTMLRLGLSTPTGAGLTTPGGDSGTPLTFGLDSASPPVVPLHFGLDSASALNFGYPSFDLMGSTAPMYTPCPPWFFPDAAILSLSEHEATTASGSEQGSLESGPLTASPSTERDSVTNDSLSASEKDEQEVIAASFGAPPGLKAPPNTPSHGSLLHSAGNCRPCAWFYKPSGCQSGQECKYCHVCGDGELKSRKKNKQVAMRLGLMTPKGDSSSEVDPRYSLSLACCV